MANKIFSPTQMLKCFTKDLQGEMVRIHGWDEDRVEFDMVGRIINVASQTIEVHGHQNSKFGRKCEMVFHLYQFERGSWPHTHKEDRLDAFQMFILEPAPQPIDFYEGG